MIDSRVVTFGRLTARYRCFLWLAVPCDRHPVPPMLPCQACFPVRQPGQGTLVANLHHTYVPTRCRLVGGVHTIPIRRRDDDCAPENKYHVDSIHPFPLNTRSLLTCSFRKTKSSFVCCSRGFVFVFANNKQTLKRRLLRQGDVPTAEFDETRQRRLRSRVGGKFNNNNLPVVY